MVRKYKHFNSLKGHKEGVINFSLVEVKKGVKAQGRLTVSSLNYRTVHYTK